MEALDVDFGEREVPEIPERKGVRLGCLSKDDEFYLLPDGIDAYRITIPNGLGGMMMYCVKQDSHYSLPADSTVWVDVPKRKIIAFGHISHSDWFYLQADSKVAYLKTCTHGPRVGEHKGNAKNGFGDWIHLHIYDRVYIDRKDE